MDSDGSPSNLIQRTQRNVPRSLWSDTLYFIFVLVTKIREMTRPTLIILSNDVGTNLDYAGAVVCQHACMQPLVRWHGKSPVCKIRRRTPH